MGLGSVGPERCEMFATVGCPMLTYDCVSGAKTDLSACTPPASVVNGTGSVAHVVHGPVPLFNATAASNDTVAAVTMLLRDLRPATAYVLRAQASNYTTFLSAVGWGAWSVDVQCSTTAATPTTQANAASSSSSSSSWLQRDVAATAAAPAPSTAPGTPPATRFMYFYRMTECAPQNLPGASLGGLFAAKPLPVRCCNFDAVAGIDADFTDNKDVADLEGTTATYTHDMVMRSPTTVVSEYVLFAAVVAAVVATAAVLALAVA